MSFKLDPSGIIKGLDKTVMKTQATLNLYGKNVSEKLEAEAKEKRPWKDHSHDARNRITATLKPIGSHRSRIELSHGVYYGEFLEYDHEERFAILQPTIDRNTPSIIRGMNNLLGK